MKILAFYNSLQTYTNTVFEHINSFAKYSKHEFFFCHCDQYLKEIEIDLSFFDAIIIHYSVRLPYDEIPDVIVDKLANYRGLKVLFIQDEYNYTYRAWYWIKRLGFSLVFTVVPEANIQKVYPPAEFPSTRFVNNLTGYVPDLLPDAPVKQTSARSLVVGYRGRPLPIEYGDLGYEKVQIGNVVKRYCTANNIAHDIEWDEKSRIYGPKWYDFMASCRSMLGSESGSNVFDWDGKLAEEINCYKKINPFASDEMTCKEVIKVRETTGLMNQISPRIFESIACRTALVLFRGAYSNVVKPDLHYIPVEKDGSNLHEVFRKLADENYVDSMVARAYHDIINSGLYSYAAFINLVDKELAYCQDQYSTHGATAIQYIHRVADASKLVTRNPQQHTLSVTSLSPIHFIWRNLSEGQRKFLRPYVTKFFKS